MGHIAAAHAAEKATWLKGLVTEIGMDLSSPTTLHVDNQSAIANSRDPEFHDCPKHIKVRPLLETPSGSHGDLSPVYADGGTSRTPRPRPRPR